MTCFRGAKRVHKMATGKSEDELLQHDNKMRIWTRSGKFRKVENPEWSLTWWQSTRRIPMTTSMLAWHCMTRTSLTTSMIAWHCMTRTSLTTSMIAWQCTMRTPLTTSTDIHMSIVRILSGSLVFTSSAHTCTLAQAQTVCAFTSPPCAWSSVRSLHLDSPSLFPALPSAFFLFLKYLKSVVNLHNSANESMDSTDEFSLSTFECGTADSWPPRPNLGVCQIFAQSRAKSGNDWKGWAIFTDGGDHTNDRNNGGMGSHRLLTLWCQLRHVGPVITAIHMWPYVAFAGASQHSNNTAELLVLSPFVSSAQ